MSEITVGDTPPGGTVLGMRMVPSDADVEALRRAMVEAHQTWLALKGLSSVELDDDGHAVSVAAMDAWIDAARAWVAAKRARGGDRP